MTKFEIRQVKLPEDIEEIQFGKYWLADAREEETDVERARFSGEDLTCADLHGMTFEDVVFEGCRMEAADLARMLGVIVRDVF